MAMLKLEIREYTSYPPREVGVDEEVYEIIKLTLADVPPQSGNLLRKIKELRDELVSEHGFSETDAHGIVFSACKAMQEERRRLDTDISHPQPDAGDRTSP